MLRKFILLLFMLLTINTYSNVVINTNFTKLFNNITMVIADSNNNGTLDESDVCIFCNGKVYVEYKNNNLYSDFNILNVAFSYSKMNVKCEKYKNTYLFKKNNKLLFSLNESVLFICDENIGK